MGLKGAKRWGGSGEILKSSYGGQVTKGGPTFIGGGDPSRHCVKVYIYLIFKDDNRSMCEFMKFGYSDAIKAR